MRRRRRSGGLRAYLESDNEEFKTKTLNTATEEDCRILAYYLYNVCDYKVKNYPDQNETEEYLSDVFRMFIRLAKKLGVEGAANQKLAKMVLRYARNGALNVISEFDSEENEPEEPFAMRGREIVCFDGTEIPYVYQEDKRIDRICHYNSDKISLMEINLYRCYLVNDGLDFMPLLIANFLLKKTPTPDAIEFQRITPQLKKSLDNPGNFDFLRKSLGLSANEIKLLQCSYRCCKNANMWSILSYFTTTCLGEVFARIIGISKREYDTLLRQDSKIRMYGFISEDGRVCQTFCDCIEAGSMQPYFTDLLKKQEGDCYPLESFNIPENTKELMGSMLEGDESVSFLLYGNPGSGKTEFAKSLAKKSGHKVFVFKNEREVSGNEDGVECVLSRLNCLLSMNSKDTIYIIDEADSILQTRTFSFFGMTSASPNKGIINKMLEESHNKIIWIVNSTSQIDDSTLRRFTYSYKFDAMSRTQLRSITENKLKPLALEDDVNNQILDLMEYYKVTGASVDNIVKAIKSLRKRDDSLVQGVKSVLKENSLLLNGKARMRETVSSNYDLSVLNASMDPAQIVRMIKNAREYAETTNTGNEAQNGIRMLFYGVSGTGKTEFARYIAQELGSKILLKRASDILDKYVGESEKNIRDAFEEAARTDSILLFDEADSFFADRNGAAHSWERTQVNEFLTQMEEFPGILICTTNLKNIMDPAMNRRFHIITEFKPLNSDGIHTMLNRYFSQLEFDEGQVSRLDRLSSVTPGDFGVLSSRIRFMDSSERTSDYIISELCKIQDEKQGNSRTVGFSM